jgi:type II secretory pathway component PulM
VAELEQRGKKAALVGGILNLIVVVVVFLMVWKPGV